MGRPRFFWTLNILPPADPGGTCVPEEPRPGPKALPDLPPARRGQREQLPGRRDGSRFLDLELSVCAMGPTKPHEDIIAMRVWVWQEADTTDIAEDHEHGESRAAALEHPEMDTTTVTAASAGNGGVHLGATPCSPPCKIFRSRARPG